MTQPPPLLPAGPRRTDCQTGPSAALISKHVSFASDTDST